MNSRETLMSVIITGSETFFFPHRVIVLYVFELLLVENCNELIFTRLNFHSDDFSPLPLFHTHTYTSLFSFLQA